MRSKFIFVVGGVLSGLGKGIVTSSIAKLLQSEGYNVTCVKIDPYLNLDAGTMRPTEHGEVWVTEDGGEIDQDLGNYERFLGKNIPKSHNITTGQIYKSVIEKERRLEYGGRNAEVIPDVVNEIKDRIKAVEGTNDFVLVEVGGTTGDIQNLVFLHAAREIARERPTIFILVTYLPFLRNVGELKTKPTQHATAMLREIGIAPDFIVARSEIPIDEPRINAIMHHCFIDKENIIANPDLETIYEVPLLFEEQEFGHKVLGKFGLTKGKHDLEKWKELVNSLKNSEKEVNIAVVGKYVSHGSSDHSDVYLSVVEALKHAGAHAKVRPKIRQIQSTVLEKEGTDILKGFDGIIVPGGFGTIGVEGKIQAIRYCRENNVPFLGLCYGMQLAVVEFARNVCGLEEAHTTEVDPDTKHPVIDILPEQKDLMKEKKYGATMRLGAYPALLKAGTLAAGLYGTLEVSERHRHRYEVNPEHIEILEKNGLIFSGVSPDRRLMEFAELPNHRFFIGTQAHPEMKSRFEAPAPLFSGFVNACLEAKKEPTEEAELSPSS
jgi:CTP synthase